MTHEIGIIGAGAWGTALAQVLAATERETILWAHESAVVESINKERENTIYLPGIPLHESIKATNKIKQAAGCKTVLVVVPAQHIRGVLREMRPHLKTDLPVVVCTKGVELETGLPMTRVMEEELPGVPVAILSGPSFASEIAKGLPGAVTLAAPDKDLAKALQERMSNPTMRIYVTDDVIGAQIGGAVKNVIAIACGIAAGLGLGDSARAALTTRGLAEMGRLTAAMGGKKETLTGMCGMGDLMLTCSSLQSRNYSLGRRMGEGGSPDDVLSARRGVTEGVATAEALVTLAERHAVEMPVCETVYRCLYQGLPVERAVRDLLERPPRSES